MLTKVPILSKKFLIFAGTLLNNYIILRLYQNITDAFVAHGMELFGRRR